VKPWVAYSLIRVAVFAAVFAILMVAGAEWWLAAVIAAVVGLCVAYIFFGGLRDRVAADIASRRAGQTVDVDADAAAEDRD